MMKHNILSILMMCAVFCLMASTAMANIICPENMTLFSNENDQEICVPIQNTENQVVTSSANSLNAQNAYIAAINEQEANYVHSKSLQHSIATSGFLLEVGFGYSMVTDALIQFNAEYQFDATNHEHVSFGINTKLNLRVGSKPTFGVDWYVAPAIHFNTGIFRASFTLGIGLFWEKPDDDYYKDYDNLSIVYTQAVTVELVPGMKFDFVLIDGLWLGFGLDVPLVFARQYWLVSCDCENWEDYKKIEFSGHADPWFNFDVHVGYKF